MNDTLPLIKRPRGRPPKNPVNKMEENTLRPPVREEDPRAAAAKRAAELRAHSSEIVEASDKFYVPPEIIPESWLYEWKTHTIYGQEDPTYQVRLAREGWEPVPASRHPEMMPIGSTSETILRDGLILMQIPREISDERRAAELRRARAQVRVKEEQLGAAPAGQFERDAPKVRKDFSPIKIPD